MRLKAKCYIHITSKIHCKLWMKIWVSFLFFQLIAKATTCPYLLEVWYFLLEDNSLSWIAQKQRAYSGQKDKVFHWRQRAVDCVMSPLAFCLCCCHTGSVFTLVLHNVRDLCLLLSLRYLCRLQSSRTMVVPSCRLQGEHLVLSRVPTAWCCAIRIRSGGVCSCNLALCWMSLLSLLHHAWSFPYSWSCFCILQSLRNMCPKFGMNISLSRNRITVKRIGHPAEVTPVIGNTCLDWFQSRNLGCRLWRGG